MTDLLKFVREWADFDKNTEYLFGYLHPTVSCCIPDPQLKITKFKIQLQLQNQVTVTVHNCPVQWRTLQITAETYQNLEKLPPKFLHYGRIKQNFLFHAVYFSTMRCIGTPRDPRGTVHFLKILTTRCGAIEVVPTRGSKSTLKFYAIFNFSEISKVPDLI